MDGSPTRNNSTSNNTVKPLSASRAIYREKNNNQSRYHQQASHYEYQQNHAKGSELSSKGPNNGQPIPKAIIQTAGTSNHKSINLMEIQRNQQRPQGPPSEPMGPQKLVAYGTKTAAGQQGPKSRLKFINKRNSQQPIAIKIEAKRYDASKLVTSQGLIKPQIIQTKQGKAIKLKQDPNKQQMSSIGLIKARDGSIERRIGDQDQIQFDEDEFSIHPQGLEPEYLERWKQIQFFKNPQQQQSARRNHHNTKGGGNQRNLAKKSRRNQNLQHKVNQLMPPVDSNILFNDGENILESRAYLSNQPNISNKIGNGANNLNPDEQHQILQTNIQEESNEGITQKDIAQNYESGNDHDVSRVAGSTESENFDETEIAGTHNRKNANQRERVTWQNFSQKERQQEQLMIMLEDPFQDKDVGADMDEYENINDEGSNDDEAHSISQTDTANIQSKYRTVNIDSYKSAGSVRSRSPNYRCQMDDKIQQMHSNVQNQQINSHNLQNYRDSYQNNQPLQQLGNFRPPKSPVSITSLGSKGGGKDQLQGQNQTKGGKLKLNLDRVLDNQVIHRFENVEGSAVFGDASQKLTYRNQIITQEDAISTPNSLSSEENYFKGTSHAQQSRPIESNLHQKSSFVQNQTQEIKIINNNSGPPTTYQNSVPTYQTLAQSNISLVGGDATATPQFKHNQFDEANIHLNFEQLKSNKQPLQQFVLTEKGQSVTDKKSMMFGFQKGKEIHMDQVRDRSKQRRGTTQVENRNNKEIIPMALKFNQQSPYNSKITNQQQHSKMPQQRDGRGNSLSQSMSPHTATTPNRQLSLQPISAANHKSKSFISPNDSNYAGQNKDGNHQSPSYQAYHKHGNSHQWDQSGSGIHSFNLRDESVGNSNTAVQKLKFMKSEESVPGSGWPNIINQKQSNTQSTQKVVHFQSSPGHTHQSSKEVKPFKKNLKELLIGPSHLKQIHNGPMAPQKQYLHTDDSESEKKGLTNSVQRPNIVPKLKLNDLIVTQNTTLKNSPNRPLNNTMNKLQIGNLMKMAGNENVTSSMFRPTPPAAVTERDETMRIKELSQSGGTLAGIGIGGTNGTLNQGSSMIWQKHLHGPRIDNNLNQQYRRNMVEKEGEISQTSSFGRSSHSDLTAQSNRTQEKDFTPGQHQQFKSFLKSQTVDRDENMAAGCTTTNTEDKLINSLLASQATLAHDTGHTMNSMKKSQETSTMQGWRNVNKDMQNNKTRIGKSQKYRIRAQTRQVQSKQDDDLVGDLKIGEAAKADVVATIVPYQKKEQKRRQNVRHVKQNSHMNISNRMSPTPQPIPIEIFSHTESDGNNSSHRLDINEITTHLQTNQRLKYRGGQKKFIASKFTLNTNNNQNNVANIKSLRDESQKIPTNNEKIRIINYQDPRSVVFRDQQRQQKRAYIPPPGMNINNNVSDSMQSVNESNIDYDSSSPQPPRPNEQQKSVRQMLRQVQTNEMRRFDTSVNDDEAANNFVDFIDDEGILYNPIGSNIHGHRNTNRPEEDASDDDLTDSANLSNLQHSVNEMDYSGDLQLMDEKNTQSNTGIFNNAPKNKMQPNKTLMQGHMMPKSIQEERVGRDSNQKSIGLNDSQHHQQVSPLNGSNTGSGGGANNFDLTEFGKLLMSQFNPFKLANLDHVPQDHQVNHIFNENSVAQKKHKNQYQINDYQTSVSQKHYQHRQTAPPGSLQGSTENPNKHLALNNNSRLQKAKTRFENEHKKKRVSHHDMDDSLDLQTSIIDAIEENNVDDDPQGDRNLKNMVLDTERRRLLSKKRASAKGKMGTTGHKDHGNKSRRHKENMKTAGTQGALENGRAGQKGRNGPKKVIIQSKKTDNEQSRQAMGTKFGSNQREGNTLNGFIQKLGKQSHHQVYEYTQNSRKITDSQFKQTAAGEIGTSQDHNKEEISLMLKKQQFSARKQYFNENSQQMPQNIEKQASAGQDEKISVSVEIQPIKKSLKNQSLKSGAKSQSSLNDDDRVKNLKSQFMNIFAFGGGTGQAQQPQAPFEYSKQLPNKDNQKEILETRKSHEVALGGKIRNGNQNNMMGSFKESNEMSTQNHQVQGKTTLGKQERVHKTLSLQTNVLVGETQKTSKCHSPKFNKPQLVKPPNQNNNSKEPIDRVTPLNISQIQKFNLFHPRTTKNIDIQQNNQENLIGDISSVKALGEAMVGLRGDLASVRSSQMVVLRSNQKDKSENRQDMKTFGHMNIIKSARGHTEERRDDLFKQEFNKKNKQENTFCRKSNSQRSLVEVVDDETRGQARDQDDDIEIDNISSKQLHYRGLNKPMSTMMIMRNNNQGNINAAEGQTRSNGRVVSNKNPKHFVFPMNTQQANQPNANHSSTIHRTMNTQILSMIDNKSQKQSTAHKIKQQSFLSQQHDSNQEGSIIESARQHVGLQNGGSSANQPTIAHYQRHSFIEDHQVMVGREDLNDETNAEAFEIIDKNGFESSNISPKKYQKNPELQFMDDVKIMVKKSKNKISKNLEQQKSAPRNEYNRIDDRVNSQNQILLNKNNNNQQQKQHIYESNPLLTTGPKSKSFNHHFAPSQPLPFPKHHLQNSHLSSIISHNVQSQVSNGGTQLISNPIGATSQISYTDLNQNAKNNFEQRSNSLSSERQLIHRDLQNSIGERSSTGQQVKLKTFTKVASVLQQYHQHSGDQQKENLKENGMSDSMVSRNHQSSIMIEMQETIPLDQIHQEKTDITMDRNNDEGSLQEATIWNPTNKKQPGAWSQVSLQKDSALEAQRQAIGPKGTTITISDAVRKHNRQLSKTFADIDQGDTKIGPSSYQPSSVKKERPMKPATALLKQIETDIKSSSKKKQKQQQLLLQDEQLRIEEENALKTLPVNGCCCNGVVGTQQKRGCINAEKWLKLSFKDQEWVHFNNYKLYQMQLKSHQMNKDDGAGGLLNLDSNNIAAEYEQDIKLDVERTFQHLEYFQRQEIKDSLIRILSTYSNYEDSIGYVQGMNFVVAVLLYHAGEVGAYFLLDQLMEKYEFKQVMETGLPGLRAHENKIEEIGRSELPELFEHFDKHDVTINLFSTDWIMSMFLNFVPIEMSHIYLSLFFEKGWDIFYYVAIQLLKYYHDKLLRLNDAGFIVGQIKQARLGCEHLLMLSSSQHSIQSSSKVLSQSFHDFSLRESVPVSSQVKKESYKLHQRHLNNNKTARRSKNQSELSMPFGLTSPQVPDEGNASKLDDDVVINCAEPMVFDNGDLEDPEGDDEPFEKEAVSILDDSRSDIMTEHENQQVPSQQPKRQAYGFTQQNQSHRSQSLMPQPKNISMALGNLDSENPVAALLANNNNNFIDVKLGYQMQMSSGYRCNPLVKKNTKMWKQIIKEVQNKFSQPAPKGSPTKQTDQTQISQNARIAKMTTAPTAF